MTEKSRIVVFTGDVSYSVRRGIVEIDGTMSGLSWLIALHAPQRSAGELLTGQWRNLRRNGWRWIPYQAADLWRRLLTEEAPRLDPSPLPGGEFTARAVRARPNVRFVQVSDVHSRESLDMVRAFEPDLGLSLAAPIMRRPLFSIPRLGTINLHKGGLPNYRGMPPGFWELWNDEQSVGCAVHWVNDKLDTGDIVRQATVERAKFSTVLGLQLRLDEVGAELMRDAVRDILHGTSAALPQAGHGKTYRKPTLAQAAALRRKLRRAERPRSLTPMRVIKQASSRLGLGLWQVGLGRMLTPRITVLLYHRVCDDARDNLSVGIEQFHRQMTLLRKHCQPMAIPEAVASDVVARSDKPFVAVTFDDGYLDNYVHAAAILRRHCIPAAFFVSTGLMGSNGRFPHDMRRGNPPIALMNWDHLRKMREWGFTIGSHTVSHIDCAAEPEERLRAELTQSRDHLQRELGVTAPLFAYPYGGRENMTPDRLELVKQAGYCGCLSAYGGTNVGRVNRYNVLRRGIHWEFSDEAFLLACTGLI